MAVTINAGENVKRGDLFFVDPFQVEVREELRGRQIAPNETNIISLAESLLDHGQLQPVQCRKIENHRLLLVLGFTRIAAARLIRDGFIDSHGERRQDPEFKLQVQVTDANDRVALIRNVVENAMRNRTSAIDDAYNQQKLRERYGLSDVEIAKLYQYKSTSQVQQLRQLLNLPDDLQLRVHEGEYSIAAALELNAIPEADRAAVAEASKTKTGTVVATQVRAQVRKRQLAPQAPAASDHHDVPQPPTGQLQQHHLSDEGRTFTPAPPTTNGTAKALTLKEVKQFFVELAQEFTEPEVHVFSEVILEFIAGKTTEAAVYAALREITGNPEASAVKANRKKAVA